MLSVGKSHTVSLKTRMKANLNWLSFLSEHTDHVSTSTMDLLLSSWLHSSLHVLSRVLCFIFKTTNQPTGKKKLKTQKNSKPNPKPNKEPTKNPTKNKPKPKKTQGFSLSQWLFQMPCQTQFKKTNCCSIFL